MAYNDDSVLAKLSAVNESHESIASSAQWIIFHRRYAERTVHLWMQKLKNSSSTKRLSLIYLANEVSQQSKARNKMEFIAAFSPTIAEAIATAYKGAPTEIQGKLKRVIDVWRDRRVFDEQIQADIDTRVADLDKSRGSAAAAGFAPFNSTQVPKELAPLVPLYQATSNHALPVKTAYTSADQDYKKLKEPSAPTPSAPVYAARLNGLLKLLGTAEHAVLDSVTARRELVNALDKILDAQKIGLQEEEALLADLQTRKKEIIATRDEVENSIMRGLGMPKTGSLAPGAASASGASEPDRPVMEALTPPSVVDTGADEEANGERAALASQYQTVTTGENGSNKRRRVDNEDAAAYDAGNGEADMEEYSVTDAVRSA
ncbi:hypothetical protein TD95_004132 [Thielaviopsis punctulata]|uniref:CID domain-containing protein n=1 Tax=Thielaviopsis punctulata TaxID=72032 RepID=A0A0F4ZBF1_9PEZI|nr:hypothetical protein TD95_004132 [Thielaviopsis punctulata]